jgi:RNA polymerase sigma-70 factor (ECF subfamily)
MGDGETSQDSPRLFPVTEWTVVLTAGGTPSPESAAALERLCGAYWYPLYAFLLMAMKRFRAKEWDKAKTIKRGGQVRLVPIQLDAAETRYGREPADTRTPEQVFEKQWALALLESVLNRLREDYERDGKGALFQMLEPCLVGSRETQPYAALGAQLGMSEGATRVAACRLRERYREYLESEIAQTVASAAEVDEERRHLLRVMARR